MYGEERNHQGVPMQYKDLIVAAKEFVAEERPSCTKPEEAADMIRPLVQNATQESLFAITLDSKNKAINVHEVTRGLVDKSSSHPREVFRAAIIDNASRVVLAHNHPSGDPTPSRADLQATQKLVNAGQIIGIELLDHVIVGAKTQNRAVDHYSLLEAHVMPKPKEV
jgi:DNA repair protein RadC